jgi:hypothetical protein
VLGTQAISATSLLRILAEHPVKPWQYQSWIYPRDPHFEAKAKVILDLYQGWYGGEPLRPGDRILSFDAKPQINARRRLHRTLPAGRGKRVRYEHEYKREGSLALLTGLDVHTGQVFGSTPVTTGILPFMKLAARVMARPEYTNAPRVFVIAGNGSDHRGQAAIRRLAAAWPNAIMIHTPIHASWLNQIEIFFSVIQKKEFHGPLGGPAVADENWVPSRRRRAAGWARARGPRALPWRRRAGRCIVGLACRPSCPYAFGPFVAVRKSGTGDPSWRVTTVASS